MKAIPAGRMEYWNNGKMEKLAAQYSNLPSFHYSGFPIFHHSIIPVFRFFGVWS
jgi:hypothetical protein